MDPENDMNSEFFMHGGFTPSEMRGNTPNQFIDNGDLNQFFEDSPLPPPARTHDAMYRFDSGLPSSAINIVSTFTQNSMVVAGWNLAQQQLFADPAGFPFTPEQPIDPASVMGPQFAHGLVFANNPPQGPSSNRHSGAVPNAPAEHESQAAVDEDDDEEAPTVKPKKRRRSRKKTPSTKEEEEDKREKFLQRNREAASKCRNRRKEWTQNMEDRARDLQTTQKLMIEEIGLLLAEKQHLQRLIQVHHACHNEEIDEFLKNQARAYAHSTPISRTNSHNSLRNRRSIGFGGPHGNDVDMGSPRNYTPAPMSRMNSTDGDTMGCDQLVTQEGVIPPRDFGMKHESMSAISPIATTRSPADPSLYFDSKQLREMNRKLSSPMSRQNSAGEMSRQNSGASHGSGQHDSGFSSMGTPEKPKEESPEEGLVRSNGSVGNGIRIGNPRMTALNGLAHPSEFLQKNGMSVPAEPESLRRSQRTGNRL